MPDELSLIRFCSVNFFYVLLNSRPFQPISTLLIKLVESLIASEEEPDKYYKDRVKWIYEHTHEKVNENLAIIELAVFKNLDRGLNREIEIGDKTFLLIDLYKYLDEVSKELSEIVIKISARYSLDIPIMTMSKGTSQSISIND